MAWLVCPRSCASFPNAILVFVFGFFLTTPLLAYPGSVDPIYPRPDSTLRVADGYAKSSDLVAFDDDSALVVGTCGAPYFSSGPATKLCFAKFLSDGSPALSFGVAGLQVIDAPGGGAPIGSALDVFADGSGRLLISLPCLADSSATTTTFCLVRTGADGLPDPTFGVRGAASTALPVPATPKSVRVVNGGSIYVGGVCASNVPCIAKYLADGSLDRSFGADGLVQVAGIFNTQGIQGWNVGVAISSDSDGATNIVGYCMSPGPYGIALCAIRLLDDGHLDTTYGNGGIAVNALSDYSFSVVSQQIFKTSAGDLLVGGYCWYSRPTTKVCFAKLNSRGDIDRNFGDAGILALWSPPPSASIDAGWDNMERMSLVSGGTILVTGYCGLPASGPCVWSMSVDGMIQTNFAGFGRYVHERAGPGVTRAVLTSQKKILLAYTIFLDPVDPAAFRAAGFSTVRLKGTYDAAECKLNANGDSEVVPLDGLLLVRYLLGLRGTALTDGAVGPNPGRTSAEIETYLADLLARGKLDADGDGQTLAMTDGLLILRAMLGLASDALTAGAVNTAHPNARNAQQILTWIESTHGVACLP